MGQTKQPKGGPSHADRFYPTQVILQLAASRVSPGAGAAALLPAKVHLPIVSSPVNRRGRFCWLSQQNGPNLGAGITQHRRESMPFAKLPQNRLTKMTSLVVALSTLAALAYLGWALSDATPTTPAHSISATDDHYPVMMPWAWGIPVLVSMNSTASTSEHRDGRVIITDAHGNSIHIPFGAS